MKVLLVNTTDYGGAAKACIRLHKGLLADGIDSKMLVLYKTDSSTPHVYQFSDSMKEMLNKKSGIPKLTSGILSKFSSSRSKYLDHQHEKMLKGRLTEYDSFTFPDSAYDIKEHPLYVEADIIHLHWVSNFLDYKTFFQDNYKKIVWTLHDMNPITGGCHYSGGCYLHRIGCSNCPQLQGTVNPRYSDTIFKTKLNAIQGTKKPNLTITAPSNWLLEKSKQSKIFNNYLHEHIPNSCEPDVFSLKSREMCRKVLSIPQDKKIILFVSDSIENRRKGFRYLTDAIPKLENQDNICLCTVGRKNALESFSGNIIEFGTINDDSKMAMLYSAADVFVIPSLEDNLPNTIVEALLCGTPVIGFKNGGIPEMIENGINGILSEESNSKALAASINTLFTNSNFDRNLIREKALAKYDTKIQSLNFIKLYNKL